MTHVSLRKANLSDQSLVVEIDYRLDKLEHSDLKRAEKIAKSISGESCFLILADSIAVGFVIFDYRFFDQGWIELLILEEEHRGKGIAGQVFELLARQCQAAKMFTSTNSSNLSMQKALIRSGFTYAGKVEGLDEGDPELFYYREALKGGRKAESQKIP